MKYNTGFLVNDHPGHRFSKLHENPEAQLVMLVPAQTWDRVRMHIQRYEAISLAGRFGANPGEYEWEWVNEPEGIRWWRRAGDGNEYLFGVVATIRRLQGVELYGMVTVDETSPFWGDVVAGVLIAELNDRARDMTEERYMTANQALRQLRREHYRTRDLLTIDRQDKTMVRRGTIREVERFQAAIKKLFDRSLSTSTLTARPTPPRASS
jgi:hypothetical protein